LCACFCRAAPQASVEARLDAFLAGRGATRTGAHATVTTAGSGYAWLTSDDKVAFISDGRLSLALQGEAEGLLDVEDDGLSGAEVRTRRAAACHAHAARKPLPRQQPPCSGAPGGGAARANGLAPRAARARKAAARGASARAAIVRPAPRSHQAVLQHTPTDDKADADFPARRAAPQRSAWSLLGYYYDHAESDLDVRGLLALAATWRGGCEPSRNAHAPTLAPFLPPRPPRTCAHQQVLKSEMVAGLSSLSGSWAFVLQDRKARGCRVAACARACARFRQCAFLPFGDGR
jgi:hypothetical protein